MAQNKKSTNILPDIPYNTPQGKIYENLDNHLDCVENLANLKRKIILTSSNQDGAETLDCVASLLQELSQKNTDIIKVSSNVHSYELNAPIFSIAQLVYGLSKEQWNKINEHIEIHLQDLADAKHSNFIDEDLDLNAPIIEQLNKELHRLRRDQHSLSLVGFTSIENYISMPNTPKLCIQDCYDDLHNAVQKHCQICDSLGYIWDRSFLLILPGANIFKAQSLVEKILESCKKTNFVAGIAPHTLHIKDSDTFIAQVKQALQEALVNFHNSLKLNPNKAKQMDKDTQRIIIYNNKDNNIYNKSTLVDAHEKQFLFSGGK